MQDYRARYSAFDMSLRVNNVTLPEGGASYVLLTAADNNNNEVVIEFSPEQSQYLEDQFYMANRRREENEAMRRQNTQQQFHNRVDYGMGYSERRDDAARFNPEFVRPLPNISEQQREAALYPPIQTDQEPQIYKYRP